MNRVILMGRLTADPVMRTTNSGLSVANFRIAVDRDGRDKGADFFDVVAWRQTGEFVSKYFFKGKPILVEGKLQNRQWQDRDGNSRITTEVLADRVFFAGGDRAPSATTNVASGNQAGVSQAELDGIFNSVGDDDDLPWNMN